MGLFGKIWDGAKKVGGMTPLGLAGRAVFDEDFRSSIPILGDATGAQSDEEKALLAKQKQLAEEAKQRQQQMQQARMNAMGQSLLAFNPRNQMMAKMFGPHAAFTPQQFAQMAQNPIPNATPWGQGTDQQRADQVTARDAERQRQTMIQGGMSPVGPGPAPLQRRAPLPARRFG